MTYAEELAEMIANPGAECIEWPHPLTPKGYGYLRYGGRNRFAHAVAYELHHGRPVTPGLVLDHAACDNRACLNPLHLKETTNRENVLRGGGPTADRARRTHCPAGHPLTGENLRPSQIARGRRACRPCNRAAATARNADVRRACRHLGLTERRWRALLPAERAAALAYVRSHPDTAPTERTAT